MPEIKFSEFDEIDDLSKINFSGYKNNSDGTKENVRHQVFENIPDGDLLKRSGDKITSARQRPVIVITEYGDSREFFMSEVSGRGFVLVLHAKNLDTNQYYEVQEGDLLQFWIPQVKYDGKDVAQLYQNNAITLYLKDKNFPIPYQKIVRNFVGAECYEMALVKGVYGKLINIKLGRGADGYLYPIILGGVDQSRDLINNNFIDDSPIELYVGDDYTVTGHESEDKSITAFDANSQIILSDISEVTTNFSCNFHIRDNSKAISIQNAGNTTYYNAGSIINVFTYDGGSNWDISVVTEDSTKVTDFSNVFVVDAFKTEDLVLGSAGKLTYDSVMPTAEVGELVAFLDIIGNINGLFLFPGIYKIVQKNVALKFITVSLVCNDPYQLSIIRVYSETYRGMWESVYSGFSDELPTFQRLSDKLDSQEANLLYQKKQDSNLNTVNQTIVGSINEVNSIAKQANKAYSEDSYQDLISTLLLESQSSTRFFNVGQSIYIQTLEVPDVWLRSIEVSPVNYTYVDDETFILDLSTGNLIVGYYRLSALETQKVDLTDYVKNTDLASDTQNGLLTKEGYIELWSLRTYVNNQLNLKANVTDVVPFEGATKTVKLNNQSIQQVRSIIFDTNTDPSTPLAESEMRYNPLELCLEFGTPGSKTQINQEGNFTVINKTGTKIDDGKLVKMLDIDLTTKLFKAVKSDNSTELSSYVDGMLTFDAEDNNKALIVYKGLVRDRNTLGGVSGNPAYLGKDGNFTPIKPSYPDKIVVIGKYGVIHETNGTIYMDVNSSMQDIIYNIQNELLLKLPQNVGISQSTPILPQDIVIDPIAKTLTIATIKGGQQITPANPVVFFTDGDGIISRWERTSAFSVSFTKTLGVWFFHIDSSGNFIASQNPWSDFKTICSIYRFYINDQLSDSDMIVVRAWECHLNCDSASDHAWKHAEGTKYETGLDIVDNRLVSGSPNADGRNTVIALTTGRCSDDGLEYTITNTSNPTNHFEQDLGNTTSSLLNSTNSGLFKIRTNDSAGRLNFLSASRFPFLWDVATNRPQYITSSGVATLVTSSNFFVYYVYSLQDDKVGETIKIVSAEVQFANITLAESHAWENLQALYSTLRDNEIRPLYKCIFEYRSSYSSSCKYSVLREVTDIRKQKVTTTSISSGVVLASNVTDTAQSLLTATNQASKNQQINDELLNINQTKQSTNTNYLTASAGAATYALTQNIPTVIQGALPSGGNSTFTLPTATVNQGECRVYITTGTTIPTLVYSGFTPIWGGGAAPTLEANKVYIMSFEQVQTTNGAWQVLALCSPKF